MSFIQSLFRRILPAKWYRDMERESRAWVLICPNCQGEISFWNLGGIRWKATGNQRNYMKCVYCGERGWHQARKNEAVPVIAPAVESDEVVKNL